MHCRVLLIDIETLYVQSCNIKCKKCKVLVTSGEQSYNLYLCMYKHISSGEDITGLEAEAEHWRCQKKHFPSAILTIRVMKSMCKTLALMRKLAAPLVVAARVVRRLAASVGIE